MVHRVFRRVAGLWRRNIFPRIWRVAERRTQRNTFVVQRPATTRKPPVGDTRNIRSSESFSSRISKRNHGKIPDHRPVSRKFIRLLRDAVESDRIFQAQAARVNKQRSRYQKLLFFLSEELGNIQRLREKGLHDETMETELKKREYPKHLPEYRAIFNKEAEVLSAVRKDRVRAFTKMYQGAQSEILNVRSDEDRQLYHLPDKFFRDLQRTIDARRTNAVHEGMLTQIGRRARIIQQKIKNPALRDPREDADIDDQLTQVLKERKDAELGQQLNKENIAVRERELVALATPMLVERRMIEGAAASAVSRGSAHKGIKEERFNKRAEDIPRSRDAIKDELDTAKGRMLAALDKRYNKLALRYWLDLEIYLEKDASASRADFDQMYFNDRKAVLRDISVIERYIEKLSNMLRDEGLRNLEDMSSGFGSITGDGQVSSLDIPVIRGMGRIVQLKRPYIQDYVDQIDTDDPISPSRPKPEPDYEHDDTWDGEPIADEEFLDSWSMVAQDLKRQRRIQQWKEKSERKPSGSKPQSMALIEHIGFNMGQVP